MRCATGGGTDIICTFTLEEKRGRTFFEGLLHYYIILLQQERRTTNEMASSKIVELQTIVIIYIFLSRGRERPYRGRHCDDRYDYV